MKAQFTHPLQYVGARARRALDGARLVVAALLIAPVLGACSEARAGDDERSARRDGQAVPIVDAALEDYRIELLELAYRTASAFPLVPHAKDRSRAQWRVVEACFALDQPLRALEYAEGIADWRRGAGYADYAFYLAQRGAVDDVQLYLDRAWEVARTDEHAQLQAWRADQVRAKIARTHLVLGETERAVQVVEGLDPSQAGIVGAVEAQFADLSELEARLKAVDDVVEAYEFERLRAALEMCVALFERVYDDADDRAAVEEKIKSSWHKLPAIVRIDLLYGLTEGAASNGDFEKARQLVGDANRVLDETALNAEEEIRQRARLAEHTRLAGDVESARRVATEALAAYEERREEVVDMFRASVLRPLAEALHRMGDSTSSMVYKRAVEEGVVNVNPRPRADDLASTCVSMALEGVEPDEALWSRMRELSESLVEKWAPAH